MSAGSGDGEGVLSPTSASAPAAVAQIMTVVLLGLVPLAVLFAILVVGKDFSFDLHRVIADAL